MTRHTASELDQFSDRVGRSLADMESRGVPVADRHLTRFKLLMDQRAVERARMHIEAPVGGHLVIPCTAAATPDR